MNDDVIARFTITGEPRSKARPRLGRGGNVYTPAETVAAEQAVGYSFLRAARGFKPNATDSYRLVCTFFHGTRHRRDVDNMIKLVCDGLNGVAWADDCQVTELSGRKTMVTKAEARTEVVVYRGDGS